jgi:hypothetical protein
LSSLSRRLNYVFPTEKNCNLSYFPKFLAYIIFQTIIAPRVTLIPPFCGSGSGKNGNPREHTYTKERFFANKYTYLQKIIPKNYSQSPIKADGYYTAHHHHSNATTLAASTPILPPFLLTETPYTNHKGKMHTTTGK